MDRRGRRVSSSSSMSDATYLERALTSLYAVRKVIVVTSSKIDPTQAANFFFEMNYVPFLLLSKGVDNRCRCTRSHLRRLTEVMTQGDDG